MAFSGKPRVFKYLLMFMLHGAVFAGLCVCMTCVHRRTWVLGIPQPSWLLVSAWTLSFLTLWECLSAGLMVATEL